MLHLLVAAALAASVQIAAGPQKLELTDDSVRAVLHVESQTEPRLSANVGTISNLRRESSGSWAADYKPPADSVPQVAILSAVAGGRMAWTTLPLSGQGMAVVQTRPGADITVQIGARSFGPVKADEHGEAQVPVVVPPGVHEVLHLGRPIPLPVPESLRLHVVLLEDRVRADSVQRVHVRLLAVDETGKPLPRTVLVIKPGRGKQSGLERHGKGELWASWTVPPGSSGNLPLRIALSDSPGLFAEALLGVGAGAAKTIELSADRPGIVAGEATAVILHARGLDSAGNPSPDAMEVSGPAGFGTLVETAKDTYRLRVPDSFEGRTFVELFAHPRGSATPQASIRVALLPSDP